MLHGMMLLGRTDTAAPLPALLPVPSFFISAGSLGEHYERAPQCARGRR